MIFNHWKLLVKCLSPIGIEQESCVSSIGVECAYVFSLGEVFVGTNCTPDSV